MYLKFCTSLVACAVLAGCGGGKDRPAATAAPAITDWRQVATDADRERLRTWRESWLAAVAKARRAGNGPAIAAQGALFEPDRALARPLPPPGAYRCRVFKLGAKGTAMRDFTAYPYFACRIDAEGEVASFSSVEGAQRPVGLIFPDGDSRAVFLGTLLLGDERAAMDYGRDTDRDMAGILQRVGDKRWRIVLPAPAFESMLDVIEIVPGR